MRRVFGIHFGSSTMALAICQDGKTEIVTNEAGDRVTPAVVAFMGKETTVGCSARQGLARNASNTVCHVKSLLGCQFSDRRVEKYNENHACKLISRNGNQLSFSVSDVDYVVTPEHALAAIMSNMMVTARSRCGQLATYDVVISVPYHFKEEKETIKKAATSAGFNVLQIISEPSACLLAYDIGQENSKENSYCLVYRIGGQSVDATIVYVSSGIFSIVSNVHASDIGGDSLTQLLVEYLANEFRRQRYCDVFESRRSVAKLRAAAEQSKHILSSMSTAQCFVESLYEGADLNINLTRARLESVVNPLVARLLNPIDESLQEADLKREDINQVILVGGGMKMPKFQQMIAERFPHANIFNSILPDEIIAIGSARQAEIHKGDSESCIRVPCLSRGIYIKLRSGNLHCIFPHRTLVPSHAQRIFKLDDQQKSLCMELWEGNEKQLLLGKVVMKALPDNPDIHANFHLRKDGSLHVTCTEKQTAISSGITIEAAVS